MSIGFIVLHGTREYAHMCPESSTGPPPIAYI